MKQIQMLLATLILVFPFTASSGIIYVSGDVNAFSGDSSGALSEILSGTPNVGVVSGNTESLRDFLGNVSQSVVSDFSTAAISGFDLLAIGGPSFFSSGPLGLSAGDINNVRNFLLNGGNVFLQLESTSQTDFDSYNAFLTTIGSSILFTGGRNGTRVDFGDFYQCNACNVLSGGTETRAQFQTGTFQGQFAFASENIGGNTPSVPAPSALSLFALAVIGFGSMRKKQMS